MHKDNEEKQRRSVFYSTLILMEIGVQAKLMILTFLPLITPGESPSTMNPVNALLAGTLGSATVRARTKNQLAYPPFVIHIFCPFRTYVFPFFSARVLIPATSDPAVGSVTQ